MRRSQAGGRVHLLLGNHEVMNLIGDLRYVAVEEYAAFQDFESPERRERWYQQFRVGRPADADEASLRSRVRQNGTTRILRASARLRPEWPLREMVA